MTMGVSECQADLFRGTGFVGDRVGPGSVFALLFREGDRLFPDSMFADLFSGRGRRSVAPRTVASVMVLQRWFGLSDREAVEAFEFDVRWRYACGGLGLDSGGFCHTVLVGMRARLAASESPRRIFDVVLDAARAAGAVSPRRVLDSAPIYDAVATEDTVTMLRSAIRRTLAAADAAGSEQPLRAVLRRDDDYASGGKAVCDWEDPAAREALVAELAADASAVLEAMRGRALTSGEADAAELLAAVVGQDLEAGPDNKMRIARRVAVDRVISTADPDARHGRKSTAGGFDGYKGHIAVDPDSELITDTSVTAGNAADASAAAALIKDLTNNHTSTGTDSGDSTGTDSGDSTGTDSGDSTGTGDSTDSSGSGTGSGTGGGGVCGGGADVFAGRPVVYGDSAYGSGEFQQFLRDERINSRCRTQKPAGRGGLYSKDRFDVDVHAGAVTCPAGVRVQIRFGRGGDGAARFGAACEGCEQRPLCTEAKGGRTIRVSRHEAVLADARARQTDPAWKHDYRATRPKVERKLAHLKRRWHGGRRARVRGRPKVDADFNLLAAAVNLARLAALGLHSQPQKWAIA